MQREQFNVDIAHADEGVAPDTPPEPELVIEFEGPHRQLTRELQARFRADLSAPDIEIRIRTLPPGVENAAAVVSLADSVTGSYMLECEVETATLREFVERVQTYAAATEDDPSYLVRLETRTGQFESFRTYMLLVYRTNGTLHREQSLIPEEAEL